MRNLIPKRLQAVLWSQSLDSLDIDKNKTYIIHQILSHGRLEDISWVLHNYPQAVIKNVFTKHPFKDYDNARFNFIKNYLLNLKNEKLNEKLYVKNTPRDIR